MKGKNLLITLALSAVLFTGCGIKSAQTIIKVNDTKITQAQFDELFDKQAKAGLAGLTKVDIKNPKNAFLYNLTKNKVVNELIVRALLNDEADKRGIKVTKEDMDDAIKVVIDKVGTKEQLDKILKHNGISASEFKKDLEEQVRMKKLAESLGGSEVSDAEAKEFYNKNADKFKHPELVRASHILIAVNLPELEEEVRKNPKYKKYSEDEIKAQIGEVIREKELAAKELTEQLQKDPSSFEKLAKSKSDDKVSAEKGGDLGFFAEKDMVPEFAKAAFGAKPNTIVGPVKSQFGYHIIVVTDRKAAGQDSFDKVKNNIKDYLENAKQLEAIEKLVDTLKKNAKIEFVKKDMNPDEIAKQVQESMKESIKNQAEGAKTNGEEPAKADKK